MQRSEFIEPSNVGLLIQTIFDGDPYVYEASSKYDTDLVEFIDPSDLESYIESKKTNGKRFIDLVIHYPDAKGFVAKAKN